MASPSNKRPLCQAVELGTSVARQKILDLVVTVVILLMGMAAYGSGGTMVIRLIGIPIPAWIFFPVMLLILFSEIRALARPRHKTELASELAARARLANLTKAPLLIASDITKWLRSSGKHRSN